MLLEVMVTAARNNCAPRDHLPVNQCGIRQASNVMKSNVLELLSLTKYDFETSVLYNLEPIRLDTPLVEGLTSYISRVSGTHSLIVQDLLLHNVIPHYNHSINIEK